MALGRAEQRSIVAKVRVYELAKEFGVESKAVMAELEKMGEFVRSASSTIEAPVVRRLKESFAGDSAKSQRQGQRPAEARPAAPSGPPAPSGRRHQGSAPGDARRDDRDTPRVPDRAGPVQPVASPAASNGVPAPAEVPTAPSAVPSASGVAPAA